MTQILYRVAVITHVLSAIVWIGGVVFMGMIAVPAAKKFNDKLRRKILDDVGRRFRRVGWTAISLLLISGSYLLYHWGATWSTLLDLSYFSAGHTRMLGYKLILVVAMIAVSAVHDFWLGPRATRENRTDEEIAQDRKYASWLGRITGVLALSIAVLAVFVARPWA